MYKKGQGISINVIIIAAIALAVLVVLFAIFTGRLGSFSKGVSETVTCENSCKAVGLSGEKTPSAKAKDCTAPNRYLPGSYSDITSSEVCCCKP